MNEIAKSETNVTTIKQRGFEQVSNEDLIIPRAKLLQALSPEVTSGQMRPGDIITNISLEKLPEKFVPVFMFKSWIRWNPRKKGDPGFDVNHAPGAIIWRSNDAHDQRVIEGSRFGADGELPLVTSYLNFLSYFAPFPHPVILSFSKTNYSIGKKLLSLAKFSGDDMFARVYTLGTEMKSNESGDFYVYTVTPAGNNDSSVPGAMYNLYAPYRENIVVAEDEDQNSSYF